MSQVLIVDGQIFQTNAWYRGMGNYVRSLLTTFITTQNDCQVAIVLNRNLSIDSERLAQISVEMPGATLVQLDLPIDPEGDEPDKKARQAIDEFIDQTYAEDDQLTFFSPCPFLFFYAAVFPTRGTKVIMFYDLTPLLFWDSLGQFFPPPLYFRRFRLLYEADVVLTDSQTTADDVAVYFGLAAEKVVNINGAIKPLAGKQDVSSVLERLHLKDTLFIIMPNASLPHKNNLRAVEGFQRFKEGHQTRDVKLVITSVFDDYARKELQTLAHEDLVFSGNLTGEEMHVLFENCAAVLMPSLYEGLGIPLLEGVEYQKPVLCADIPVFREVPHYKEAFYVFDPYDPEEIADAIWHGLAGVDFESKRAHYAEITDKYNWPHSVAELTAQITHPPERPRHPHQKVALLCPDPRVDREVAAIAQRLYGYALRAGIELVYFIDPGKVDDSSQKLAPDYVRWVAQSYDICEVYHRLQTQEFSKVLHFVSNDPQYMQLFRGALTIPGILYVAQSDFWPAVQQLAKKKLISEDQLVVEARLHQAAEKGSFFDGASLLGNAQAVVAQKSIAKKVRRALSAHKITLPVFETPSSDFLTEPEHALKRQAEVFPELLKFIKEGK
ncbi:MAG TPA: glycosyltransferase family 1 protein [Candidatus Saccharimonadales bacterium]|nr:glycosyltransferase family 1 protein [Candidatus Saccharimonadales bacterium]